MTTEEQVLIRDRSRRIALTKKWMRWLPRRSNIHRYPVLKWFADTARARSYLWSFRVGSVIPAFYGGSILAFQPLYGLQAVLAVLIAILLRANLPILFGLQFITNPMTIIPVYFSAYHIGRFTLMLVDVTVPHLSRNELRALLHGAHDNYSDYILTVLAVTSFGSLMLGVFVATVASAIYKFMAYEVTLSIAKLKELKARREAAHAAAASAAEECAPTRSPTDDPPKGGGV
jgi:uncharacterized protein